MFSTAPRISAAPAAPTEPAVKPAPAPATPAPLPQVVPATQPVPGKLPTITPEPVEPHPYCPIRR